MISVNGTELEFTKFPDGTTSFRYEPTGDFFNIQWNYEGDHECMMLWFLVKHIRENTKTYVRDSIITLELPYIPNARMDRVKSADEVFTLKWFADFINALKFDLVSVTDPHSNVALALIDRVKENDVTAYIERALDELNHRNKDVLLCYPDEGASKRYSEVIPMDYVFGIKHRDWRTGAIERLELTSPQKVAGRNVLIVDDICSRGGTFTRMAKELKAAGANEIYLYVTHCEDTIFKGDILNDGLITAVYTTNSIYTGEHPAINVL